MRKQWHVALLASALLVGACSSSATPTPPTAAPAATASPQASSAGGFTPVYKDGVLQPLDDGFPSKAITLVNGDDPGSDDGIYIRTLQAILADTSPVPIEVLDQPGPQFGMWTMTEVMNRTQDGKDGYEPSVAAFTGGALDIVASPVTRDLGLTMADINPVVATEKVPFVIATRSDAPWQTWQEMVDYGKAHPGEIKYLARVGSQLDIALSHLFQEAGITVNKIDGGSTTEIGTELGAGAGDIAALLPGTALPHYQAGKERILLVIGDSAPAPWTDAATTTSIGLPDEPWGTIRGFIVPAATPDSHRLWLAELFRKATESTQYQDRTQTVPGLVVVDYDKAQIEKLMQTAIDVGTPIIRSLGLAWDQQ